MSRRYTTLNMQGALRHCYNAEQVARMASALGIDGADGVRMREHFITNGTTTHLTRHGVEALASKQDEWRKAGLYRGAVDAIWGELSAAAHRKSQSALGAAEPSVLTAGTVHRPGALGPAEPTVRTDVETVRVTALGPAEPTVATKTRTWTPV